MSVKLLAEQQLKFRSLKGGCTGLSESKPAKMPHCWKSHVTAQMYAGYQLSVSLILGATLGYRG